MVYQTYSAPQGIGADLIATLEGFTREDVDRFAAESQRRAAHAWAQGYFNKAVEPVRDVSGEVLLARDEHMRPDTTLEGLGALKASFTGLGESSFDAIALQKYPQVEAINHVHPVAIRAGSSTGRLPYLRPTEEFDRQIGRKPRTRIVAFSTIGIDPDHADRTGSVTRSF